MPRASITLTDLDDGHLRFPYSAGLVANLKSQIPSHARAWTPEGRYWWVEAAYINLAVRLAQLYFPDLDCREDPTAQQQAHSAPGRPPRPLHPDPYTTLHFLPSAPLELIEAAARALAKLHHPDLKPDHEKALATATMARINRAIEDLRRARGAA